MANSWESVDVECPFYRASDRIYIRCEGLAGLTMTIYFSDKQRKAVLMERYCNCRWEDCPLHKAVDAQYGNSDLDHQRISGNYQLVKEAE